MQFRGGRPGSSIIWVGAAPLENAAFWAAAALVRRSPREPVATFLTDVTTRRKLIYRAPSLDDALTTGELILEVDRDTAARFRALARCWGVSR
jgi:hypothetical protein